MATDSFTESIQTDAQLQSDPTIGASNLNRADIVAIDDDPLTLHLLSAHLNNAGHSVQTAKTGTAGLELITDSTSVAVVDLKLPDLDGFQILQFLKEHHPTIQVIVLTGSDQVNDAVEAMRAGAFQFVTKPFDPQAFLVYIDKAIASHRIANENRGLKQSYSQNVPVREMDTKGDVHS